MAVRTVASLYPWDVDGDPSAPERLVELGVDAVVLAAAYHSVRAATPRHPRHRVVTASAASYLPVRADAWADLMPVGVDSFNRAASALNAAGLPVRAWVVLTHSSAVGLANPGVCARNAFGDIYSYALCPAQEAVRAYARTLVGEVVRQSGVTDVVLEACGPMGFSHLGHHEKTAGADWSAADEALLSICFCSACTAYFAALGVDSSELAASVRAAMGSGVGALAEVVLSVRSDASRALREGVIDEVGSTTRIAMHAVADPWATGPAAAVTGPVPGVSCIVPAWELSSAGADRLRAMHAVAPDASLAAYVTVLPPVPPDPHLVAEHWRTLIDAGAEELHLYHAGLASDRRLDALRKAIAMTTEHFQEARR